MAERVAVSRIIIGHGQSRRTIEPGQQFKTEDYNVSEDELTAWERSEHPVVRRVQAPEFAEPMTVEPIEDRSGQVQGDAISGADGSNQKAAPKATADDL